jgi:hypothetical protein
VRARVIDRASGAVVGEVEADTTYGLWLALLDWGEGQGVSRFQVPARYRTEREGTTPAPHGEARPARRAPASATPAREERPARSRGKRAGGGTGTGRTVREASAVDAAPPEPSEPVPAPDTYRAERPVLAEEEPTTPSGGEARDGHDGVAAATPRSRPAKKKPAAAPQVMTKPEEEQRPQAAGTEEMGKAKRRRKTSDEEMPAPAPEAEKSAGGQLRLF